MDGKRPARTGIATGATTKNAKNTPIKKKSKVIKKRGVRWRFSCCFRAGKTNAHSWYKSIGAANSKPTVKDALKTTMNFSVGAAEKRLIDSTREVRERKKSRKRSKVELLIPALEIAPKKVAITSDARWRKGSVSKT